MNQSNETTATPAQIALRASEQRLRTLIASANDAVVMIDTAGLVVEWNPRAEWMFGWRAAEAIGQRLSDLIVPPQHRERHDAGLRRYVATRQARVIGRAMEVRGLRRDGGELPIELSIWPLEAGGDILFGAFIRDISARHAAQAALQAQERKYRSVVDNISEGILVVREGHIVFANPSTERMVGLSLEQMRALPFTHLIHPDDQPMVRERHIRRLRGEDVEQHYPFRVLRTDGSLIWLELSAVQIDWDGEPATLSFITDITERMRLQDSLKRTLAEQEAILQSTLIGISLIAERRVQWANSTLAEMFGHPLQTLIGAETSLLFPSRGDWEEFSTEVVERLNENGRYAGTHRLCRGCGSEIWVQLQGTRLDLGAGRRGSLWTFVDVTERHRAEQETLRALEKEKELSALKSRFVSMTSHEFRTPLAGILSSIELLRHYSDRLDAAEKTELYQQVEQSVERMTQMLDNILLIGRAESRGMEFKPQLGDLAGFLQQLLDEAEQLRQQSASSAQLQLHWQGDPGERVYDPQLLRHVFGNLLSNALKYSPAGGVVEFSARVHGTQAVFVVQDQGIGIPEADLPRLFETFHRASNVGSIAGTGLGLAIVKQAAELHGGRIEVASAAGQGTRFTVHLPIAVAERSA